MGQLVWPIMRVRSSSRIWWSCFALTTREKSKEEKECKTVSKVIVKHHTGWKMTTAKQKAQDALILQHSLMLQRLDTKYMLHFDALMAQKTRIMIALQRSFHQQMDELDAMKRVEKSKESVSSLEQPSMSTNQNGKNQIALSQNNGSSSPNFEGFVASNVHHHDLEQIIHNLWNDGPNLNDGLETFEIDKFLERQSAKLPSESAMDSVMDSVLSSVPPSEPIQPSESSQSADSLQTAPSSVPSTTTTTDIDANTRTGCNNEAYDSNVVNHTAPVPANSVPANPIPTNPVPTNPVPTNTTAIQMPMIDFKALNQIVLPKIEEVIRSPHQTEKVQNISTHSPAIKPTTDHKICGNDPSPITSRDNKQENQCSLRDSGDTATPPILAKESNSNSIALKSDKKPQNNNSHLKVERNSKRSRAVMEDEVSSESDSDGEKEEDGDWKSMEENNKRNKGRKDRKRRKLSVNEVEQNGAPCCVCKRPPARKMIKCANSVCPIGLFHVSCMRLFKGTPKLKWYCKQCRRYPSKANILKEEFRTMNGL